ncbi:hypothetical protein ACQPZU_19520 [Saccharomonospora azurea]|uniref:Uncharacterized protein n=1 Tax=Saccharomonospora azurea NA-128 TaxID=882081 RepID=H8G4R5_9PSEU|nr:hypothetical protein [Saccharomonospora azurea]EHY89168.1 hypothetical protein SacazDRAFT_02258 [Saccharomonospora azurea NA-128]
MRGVRRGLIATAIAFPLAFGFAGVAAAGEDVEGSIDWASFESSFATATYQGADTGELESEALHTDFEKNGKKGEEHGDKRSGDARHDDKGGDKNKHEDENGELELNYAEFEAEGAAADALGAAAGEIEAEASEAELD